MQHPKRYFELQLKFAQRVAEFVREPFSDILLNYTSLYKAFGIAGWDFDRQNAVWIDFAQRLQGASDILSCIYDFYIEHYEDGDKPRFGCFDYEYEEKENYIQIHFLNFDPPMPGALSTQRIPARKEELTAMFREIKQKYPHVPTVAGFSWLYNDPRYTHLFPGEYIKTAKTKEWFKSMALWGQFLDSSAHVKEELASRFEQCVSNASSLDNLKQCPPYKVLEPETDLNIFYEFYQIP